MSSSLSDLGRARTRGMAAMNLRAVITGAGTLRYVARPSLNGVSTPVLARHQPRDDRGRFIRYRRFGWASERDLRIADSSDRAAH
jgi:hypothetical protein